MNTVHVRGLKSFTVRTCVGLYRGTHERPDLMPSLSLDAGDAAEVTEMLQFLADWLADDGSLAASLNRFAGHPAYGISDLHGISSVSHFRRPRCG